MGASASRLTSEETAEISSSSHCKLNQLSVFQIFYFLTLHVLSVTEQQVEKLYARYVSINRSGFVAIRKKKLIIKKNKK